MCWTASLPRRSPIIAPRAPSGYPGPGELRETHCDLTLIGLPSPTDTRLWPELGNEALLRFAGCAAAFADRACRPRRNSRRGRAAARPTAPADGGARRDGR